jgi:hypothetical protein
MTVGLLLPIAALAESAPPPPSPPAIKTDQVFVIRPTQVLMIGAGIVSGAVVVEALFSTDFGYLVGGVVGGYLAHVWYNGQQLELHLGTPPKS